MRQFKDKVKKHIIEYIMTIIVVLLLLIMLVAVLFNDNKGAIIESGTINCSSCIGKWSKECDTLCLCTTLNSSIYSEFIQLKQSTQNIPNISNIMYELEMDIFLLEIPFHCVSARLKNTRDLSCSQLEYEIDCSVGKNCLLDWVSITNNEDIIEIGHSKILFEYMKRCVKCQQ